MRACPCCNMAEEKDHSVPVDFFVSLPNKLPSGEPYYYLSKRQSEKCKRLLDLSEYVDYLPGWVPHRRVADALGHSHKGIEAALKRKDVQTPYVWCTEFENFHSFWSFDEPSFIVNGIRYGGSEHYYQAMKPRPFDKKLWDGDGPGMGKRDEVMEIAVRKKFSSENPELQQLLKSSHPHPLLSIKRDRYWGVDPTGRGENMLAHLLMKIREELVEKSLSKGN